MAELTFKSAGVSTREIDLSGPTPSGPQGVPAGIIGTAVAGPAFVPITFATFSEFNAIFGGADGEKFGPILHFIKYKAEELESILEEVNDTGYGLTMGMHSRISGKARQVFENANIGNFYLNRDIVGAVVGVQPFGGQGLSGTGPKAGGPNYLHSFVNEKTFTDNVMATGGNIDLLNKNN